MSYCQGEYIITEKKNLARNVYDLTILCPEIAVQAMAGQFVHVKIKGFTLRRPISICRIDPVKGKIRIVFEVRGEGTQALSELRAGDPVDLIGPLGKGFTLLNRDEKVVLIGGGIGTPPMLELAAYYKSSATAIIGFRSADAVILAGDFEDTGATTIVCTDDGTRGKHGFVTAALSELLGQETPAMIYACGPHPMLRGIARAAQEQGIRCEVSLEERMGCGVGACLVCACKVVKDGQEYYAHVCKDGPVFDSGAVF